MSNDNQNQKQLIKNNKKINIWKELILFDTNKPSSTTSHILSMVICMSIILYLIKIIITKHNNQIEFKINSLITNTLVKGLPVIYTQVFLSFFILKVICIYKLKMNIHVAILFTSLFSAATVYEMWFSSSYNMNTINIHAIYTFIATLVILYSYYYTNNLITPILIYFLI